MNEQQTTDTTNVQTTEQTADTSANQTAATEQTGGAGQEQQTGDEQQQQQQQEETQTPNVPASGGEYEITIDGFDVDAFKAENGAVLDRFHEAGLTNEQASEVVKIWDEFQQTNIEALQQEWGDEYQNNVNLANQAIQALGFKPEEMDTPMAVIKLAAAIGKHIQEDLPPSNTQQSGGLDIQSLLSSEAYMNESHPDHARVYAQVVAHFEKQNR